jgi:hypothetical protein
MNGRRWPLTAKSIVTPFSHWYDALSLPNAVIIFMQENRDERITFEWSSRRDEPMEDQ